MKYGRGALRHVNFVVRRRLAGRPIKIPFAGGLRVGISGEPFLLDILQHALPRIEGSVIDVGANLGQTLSKVKATDPDRAYFGFEPNAACHAYLEQLVQLNRWREVTLFPCGLAEQTRMAQLHTPPHDRTDGRGSFLPAVAALGRRALELSETRPAAVFRFAEIADQIEAPIGFVKIDVEGTERQVVQGMVEMLARDRPILTMELLPHADFVERHQATVALLKSLDYALFTVLKDGTKRWRGVQAVLDYALPDDASVSDYLAVPRDGLAILEGAPR